MKILLAANTSWYLFNFRSNLITALTEYGHMVETLASEDNYTEKLIKIGVQRHHALKIEMSGTNPIVEFMTLLTIAGILFKNRPDFIFCYTGKITIYTSLIARFLSVKTVVNVSGLGRGFSSGGFIKNTTLLLYRMAIKKAVRIFFQNFDNQTYFIEKGLSNANNSERLPGSGVDLNKFKRDEAKIEPKEKAVFLLAARLYLEKGIREYADAARIIKAKYPNTEFQIAGFVIRDSSVAVPESELNQWVADGIINFLGTSDDIKSLYSNADCAVLPSYYNEGVPRTLLEAAAMLLPIITTDCVGCRDTVDDGKSGFLCKKKDAADLALKMELFLNLSFEERLEMGKAGRKKMEQEFDENIVISKYLALVE